MLWCMPALPALMRCIGCRVVTQCFVGSKAGVGAPPKRLDQYCAKCDPAPLLTLDKLARA